MAFIKVNAIVVVFFLVVVCSLNAQIISGSFEGDPNMLWEPNGPWHSNGIAPEILHTYTHYDGYDSNYQPIPIVTINAVDGNSFVMLRCGGGTETTDHSQLAQTITVNAGESITGVYFFATNDYMYWNDAANIYLSTPEPNNITGRFDINILLAYKDVAAVGNYRAMKGWERFSYTFDSNGTYKLILRVADAFDDILPSYLAVDALKLCYLPPGDINHDCVVNFYDFAALADQWLNICDNSTWCNNCDIDKISKDNVYAVDFGDLFMMAENWLIDCAATPDEQACLPPPPPQ